MFLRRNMAGIVGLSVVVFCYWLSRPPRLSTEQETEVAGQFQFNDYLLPVISDKPQRKIRKFHPSVDHMAAWLSFVGAGVAIGDLDQNGRSDDLVYVDSRVDCVTVCPVPETGDRYEPFLLAPKSLSYNHKWMAPMGSCLGDFNEDGLIDILVYFWGRSPIIYLRNGDADVNGHLTRERFIETELQQPFENWHTNAVTQGDFDGDGHLDLLIGNYNPDGSRMLEYDNLDIEGEVLMASFGRATNGGKTRIYLSNGSDSSAASALFREAVDALSPEVAGGWVFGAGAADVNGDMLPEIYLVHDWGADRLLFNRSTPGHLDFQIVEGHRALTTPRSLAVGKDTFNGMGVDFVDLNYDGEIDFAVSNITSDYAFHQSTLVFIHDGDNEQLEVGSAPFQCQSEAYGLSRGGWAWDVKFADFNNSGRVQMMQATGFMSGSVSRWPELQELALANEELARYPAVYPKLDETSAVSGDEHNPFFVYVNDRYYDIGPKLAGRISGPTNSRGFAIADVNLDGRLDFAVANNWADSYFFQNASPDAGQFLGLNIRHVLDPQSLEAWRKTEETEIQVFEVEGGYVAVTSSPVSPQVKSRPAIGTSVTIKFGDPRSPRTQIAQVDGGNGHSGQRAPELHFGLGQLVGGASISTAISWRDPTGKVQRLTIPSLQPRWYTLYLVTDQLEVTP